MHFLERNLINLRATVSALKGKGYSVVPPTMLTYASGSQPYIGWIEYHLPENLKEKLRLEFPEHCTHSELGDPDQKQRNFNVWLDEKVVIGVVDAQHAKAAALIRLVEQVKTMAADIGVSDNGINPLDFLLAEVKNNLLPAPAPVLVEGPEEVEDDQPF